MVVDILNVNGGIVQNEAKIGSDLGFEGEIISVLEKPLTLQLADILLEVELEPTIENGERLSAIKIECEENGIDINEYSHRIQECYDLVKKYLNLEIEFNKITGNPGSWNDGSFDINFKDDSEKNKFFDIMEKNVQHRESKRKA